LGFSESSEMLATCAWLYFKAFRKIRPIFAIVTAILISQFLLLCDINLIASYSRATTEGNVILSSKIICEFSSNNKVFSEC